MTAISWKPAATIALVVIVVAAGAFALLRRGGTQEGGGQPAGEENVWVQYTASFKLLGTENNQPINELGVYFYYPHFRLENGDKIDPNPLYENTYLSFVLADNRSPPRFEISPLSYENTFRNVRLGKFLALGILGNFYPNDEVHVETWFSVPKENIARLTLKFENLGAPFKVPFDNVSIGTIANVKMVDNHFVLLPDGTFLSNGYLTAAIRVKTMVLTDGVLDLLEDYRGEMSEPSDNSTIYLYLVAGV